MNSKILIALSAFLFFLPFAFAQTEVSEDMLDTPDVATIEESKSENETDKEELKTVEEASALSVSARIPEYKSNDITGKAFVVLEAQEFGFSGGELKDLLANVYSVFAQDLAERLNYPVYIDSETEIEARFVLLNTKSSSSTEDERRSALLERAQYAIIPVVKKSSMQYAITAMVIDLQTSQIIMSVTTGKYSESAKLYSHPDGATDEAIRLLAEKWGMEENDTKGSEPDKEVVERIVAEQEKNKPKGSIKDWIRYQKPKREWCITFGKSQGAFFEPHDDLPSLGAEVYFTGGKHWFMGVDLDTLFTEIKDEDYLSQTEATDEEIDEIWFSDFNVLFGGQITVWKFLRPYATAGLGFYKANLMHHGTEASVSGLSMEGNIGADLLLGKFVVGGEYKLKYLIGSGFVDYYCFSVGWNWR